MYRIICEHPGIYQVHLAEKLGVQRNTLHGLLTALETTGMLVSEDKDGRLYPFDGEAQDMWG